MAISSVRAGMPAQPPCVLISGGETTVTVKGHGKGGRDREFALGLAIAIAGRHGIAAIACDTDGIDGSSDAAGAMVLPDTLTRATVKGLDARVALANNDAGGFFDALGDQVVTGPTRTNVNDFRAIYIPGQP
jgi:glycerate-2-kinase